MKLCRFQHPSGSVALGLITDDESILDVTGTVSSLTELLEAEDLTARVSALIKEDHKCHAIDSVRLLAPVERQEVWAAGVTYLRSKKARMDESEFSANAYDKVYDAARPELFFKALAEKVAGPGEAVGIRADAKWNVPEPELAFVINSRGQIAGFTIGNDMSSRDIEGENLLYLPQAKIYRNSCALGPWVVVGVTEAEARQWSVKLAIRRGEATAFEGATSIAQLKRPFNELVEYLFRSQSFPHGVVLLTGTGIVPPEQFTLQAQDRVSITISGVGALENTVTVV